MNALLKWVLVGVVVVMGYNWWRRQSIARTTARDKMPADPQWVQACAHCGVHVAAAEVVRGQQGVYCSVQHLKAHGDQTAN